MGLQISNLVSKHEIQLEYLTGKIIAVDAYNTLYQFLANIRQHDGTPLMDSKGNVTSHLSGLFYRTINLIIKGIKPIFVFDGKPPELKFKENESREKLKVEAALKYEKAKQEGFEDAMAKYARQTIKLTKKMVIESKHLLEAMGIPYVQAPSEGEAQAAFMTMRGDAYAVASQDYDSLLFGATKLIQNVTLARKRRLSSGFFVHIQPEMIELDKLLNTLQISRDQLICLGILVGTDFNQGGVKGIGPKRALQIVREHKLPTAIFNDVAKKYPIDFDWKAVFEIFKNPDVTKDYTIKFLKLDETKLRSILVGEHEFTEERIQNALLRLRKFAEQGKQKSLEKWF